MNPIHYNDVTTSLQAIIRLIQTSPPHVRPWLRGVESEAEHANVELAHARRRAGSRFVSWLAAGLDDIQAGDGDE